MKTFRVTYQLTLLDGESIDQKIEDICLEQSVELPREVVPDVIAASTVGQLVGSEEAGENIVRVVIQWPIEDVAKEISQFLNVLYGNISLKPGIKIIDAEWENLQEIFKGPAFGIKQLRSNFGIKRRPLSATALKPMGSSVQEIGKKCYQFARGGIDIIKDDHGLTNQTIAPFRERVEACVAAVVRAADETGRRSYYFPNITAPGETVLERYKMAEDLNADGVLVCPHLTGLPMLNSLRQATGASLPIIAHPAFSGSLVSRNDEGFSSDFLYGQLWRALGSDFVIYPNTGGRFAFSLEQCQAINVSARTKSSTFKRSFPMPGGGLKPENIRRWKETYGNDTTFLMGGSLYRHPKGIEQAAKEFMAVLKES